MFWKNKNNFSFIQKFVNIEKIKMNDNIFIKINNTKLKNYDLDIIINVKVKDNIILYENKYCFSMDYLPINENNEILFNYTIENMERMPYLNKYDLNYDLNLKIKKLNEKHFIINELNLNNDNCRTYEILIF
jgi:hypothetical protein